MRFGQSTFGAWFIANYEVFSTLLLFVVYVACFFVSGVYDVVRGLAADGEGEAVWLVLLLGALCVLFAKTFFYVPVANRGADWITLVVNVVWVVLIYNKLNGSEADGFVGVMLAEVGVSFVWALLLARSTYRNFDEVVSRRMLYRNSRVELFSGAWSYTMNRFVAVFCNTNGLLLISTAIIALAGNEEAVASLAGN